MARSDNSSRYLSVASGHINSLIDYVIDVKPYHTKLSEIVEEFLFEDHINVKIDERHEELVILGPDLLDKSSHISRKVWDKIGASRPSDTLSAQRTVMSDGVRRTFPVPTTVIPKLLSHSSQDKFVVGENDSSQIPGLTRGVFSNRRFDGAGIPSVMKDGIAMTEGVDYHISLGAFSFNAGNGLWKAANIANMSQFAKNPGLLAFDNSYEQFGSIVDIDANTSEEFKLEWNGEALQVEGSASGLIGEASFNERFISDQVNFTFCEAYGESPGEMPLISVGDTFLLTPREKITVAPDAPTETWTIIKTNPQALQASPKFERTNLEALGSPTSLSIYTRSLEWTPASNWKLEFISPTEYVLHAKSSGGENLEGYPKHVDLIDGCSYEDELIHFTIIPPINGFKQNDSFTFQVKALKPNYLVYGSESGWEMPAVAGQWYWNGRVGFKIPKLDYYAVRRGATISTSTNGEEWKAVVVSAQELTNIDYVNNAYLAAGARSIVAASIDGKEWTDDLTNFATVDNRLLVVGENGMIAMTEDGKEWSKIATHTDRRLRGITVVPTDNALEAATPNMLVVVGDSGTILTSLNGYGWTNRASGTNYNLHSVAYSNDWIIAVGANGTILRSKDRINWLPCVSPTTQTLNKVKYLNGSFFALGSRGAIATSANGVNWVLRVSNTNAELNDIAYGLDHYIAVGRGGITCKSADGEIWQALSSKPLNSIEFGTTEQMFVAVEHKTDRAANFIPLRPPHSTASPSMYSVIFRPKTDGSLVDGGTVHSNLHGYKRGFKANQPWKDEYCSFKIVNADDQFRAGEQIDVYLVPKKTFIANGNYDELPYDSTPYDSHIGKIEYPVDLLQEHFSLYHSHDSVIFPSITDAEDGIPIVIDKATIESIDFRIGIESESVSPSLAPVNGWVPLEFRYADRRIKKDSTAEFPDLATYLDAYLASDPDVLVFSVNQPRYKTSNRPATSTLTFDENFFKRFLPERKTFALRFNQMDSYGQTIRVKVSENLRVYARIRLNFDEIALVKVSDTKPTSFETIALLDMSDEFNVAFAEGGQFVRVDLEGITSVIPVDEPTITVKDKPAEIAGTQFVEGLQITVRLTAPSEVGYDSFGYDEVPYDYVDARPIGTVLSVNLKYDIHSGPINVDKFAEEYVVTHNMRSTPNVIITPVSGLAFVAEPRMIYTPTSNASLSSFSFTVPENTGPFKLTLA